MLEGTRKRRLAGKHKHVGKRRQAGRHRFAGRRRLRRKRRLSGRCRLAGKRSAVPTAHQHGTAPHATHLWSLSKEMMRSVTVGLTNGAEALLSCSRMADGTLTALMALMRTLLVKMMPVAAVLTMGVEAPLNSAVQHT
jgi:hypothetical protein